MEGETSKQNVLRLRQRQMRNLAAALLLSHGVPMILMGDEYGHSKVTLQRLRPKSGACTVAWPDSCWHASQGLTRAQACRAAAPHA